MISILRRHRLPLPRVPEALQGTTRQISDWTWGTLEDAPSLYDVPGYVRLMLDQQGTGDFFMLGHDGYGATSWYLHCCLNYGPLGILIQAPWGGAYTDPKSAAVAIERRFKVMERLLATADQAFMIGRPLPGRLIIQQSAVDDPRWGWQRPGEGVNWQDEFANAMTPALESLQAAIA